MSGDHHLPDVDPAPVVASGEGQPDFARFVEPEAERSANAAVPPPGRPLSPPRGGLPNVCHPRRELERDGPLGVIGASTDPLVERQHHAHPPVRGRQQAPGPRIEVHSDDASGVRRDREPRGTQTRAVRAAAPGRGADATAGASQGGGPTASTRIDTRESQTGAVAAHAYASAARLQQRHPRVSRVDVRAMVIADRRLQRLRNGAPRVGIRAEQVLRQREACRE